MASFMGLCSSFDSKGGYIGVRIISNNVPLSSLCNCTAITPQNSILVIQAPIVKESDDDEGTATPLVYQWNPHAAASSGWDPQNRPMKHRKMHPFCSQVYGSTSSLFQVTGEETTLNPKPQTLNPKPFLVVLTWQDIYNQCFYLALARWGNPKPFSLIVSLPR